MDSDSHSSSSLHGLTLSIILTLVVLLVAVLITLFVYFLLRRLRGTSLVLESVTHSSNFGDCAICLSSFEPEDNLRHLPLCSHAFHEHCVATWLVSNQTCPLCRSPLSVSDDTASAASILASEISHDSSRSWLRDLSRGISSRALSFRGSARFFTGSSRRNQVMDLEAGEEITVYFQWLSQL